MLPPLPTVTEYVAPGGTTKVMLFGKFVNAVPLLSVTVHCAMFVPLTAAKADTEPFVLLSRVTDTMIGLPVVFVYVVASARVDPVRIVHACPYPRDIRDAKA